MSPGGTSHDPLSPFPSPTSRRPQIPPLSLPPRADPQHSPAGALTTASMPQAPSLPHTGARTNPSLPTRSTAHTHGAHGSYPRHPVESPGGHLSPSYYSYSSHSSGGNAELSPSIPSEYPYTPIISASIHPTVLAGFSSQHHPNSTHSSSEGNFASHTKSQSPQHRQKVRVNREAFLHHRKPLRVGEKVVYLQPSAVCWKLIVAPPSHLTMNALHTLLIENDNEKDDTLERSRAKAASASKEACVALPKLVLARIFSYGVVSNLLGWSLVAKEWSEAVKERLLWKTLCERDLGSEFKERILGRLSSSITDDPYRIVYRWSMPPRTIMSAPCLSCGCDGGQKLENVFICRACSRLPLYTVLTRRQLSMQYKLTSSEIEDMFPTSGLRHNAFLMKSVLKALTLRRRHLLHRQLRSLRLSTHYKYHRFFDTFVNDTNVKSSVEEQSASGVLMDQFKKMLLEFAVHFAQHHPTARSAFAVASKMNLTTTPLPTLASYLYTHSFIGVTPQESQFLSSLDAIKQSPRREGVDHRLSQKPEFSSHSDVHTVVSSTSTSTATKTISSSTTHDRSTTPVSATTTSSPRAAYAHPYVHNATYPLHTTFQGGIVNQAMGVTAQTHNVNVAPSQGHMSTGYPYSQVHQASQQPQQPQQQHLAPHPTGYEPFGVSPRLTPPTRYPPSPLPPHPSMVSREVPYHQDQGYGQTQPQQTPVQHYGGNEHYFDPQTGHPTANPHGMMHSHLNAMYVHGHVHDPSMSGYQGHPMTHHQMGAPYANQPQQPHQTHQTRQTHQNQQNQPINQQTLNAQQLHHHQPQQHHMQGHHPNSVHAQAQAYGSWGPQ